MQNDILISISIVTWNNADIICQCIDSVLSQSYKNIEVIITDNASTDNTIIIIDKFLIDPRIKLIKMKTNIGYCGGHNYAINHSKGDFVLLINPDISLSTNYLENAMDILLKDENIGAICGLLVQSNNSKNDCYIDSAGLLLSRSRRCILRYHGKRLKDCNLITEEVFGVDGASPLYRRKMIDDLKIDGNFFDEMFFSHKEDWDVSWRSQLFGWKTVFNPSCVAIHPRFFKPMNLDIRKKMLPIIKYHGVKNQIILLLKNEDLKNFIKDIFYIMPRQLMVLLFCLFFEQKSLFAYLFILKNIIKIISFRQYIQKRRVLSSNDFRFKIWLDNK